MSAADTTASKPADGSDMICGPRCVKFILHHYGKEFELVGLVKEIQWPDLEAGASLEQVQKSLNSRGIRTAAVRFSPDRRLVWPHPAILYIVGADSPQGHYVVRVPGETADADDLIWSGMEGWRRGRWDEVTRGFSGMALLTSPDPIPNPEAAVGAVPTARLVWAVVLATSVAFVAHVIYRLFARLRAGTVVPSR